MAASKNIKISRLVCRGFEIGLGFGAAITGAVGLLPVSAALAGGAALAAGTDLALKAVENKAKENEEKKAKQEVQPSAQRPAEAVSKIPGGQGKERPMVQTLSMKKDGIISKEPPIMTM